MSTSLKQHLEYTSLYKPQIIDESIEHVIKMNESLQTPVLPNGAAASTG
jgi:hypothetical protein